MDEQIKIPVDIAENEPLLRAVSTPSCLDEENRATPLAFRLNSKRKESDISLSRLLYDSLKNFLKRSLKFSFRFLSKKDVIAGAVELQAGDVYALDEHIVLKATPNTKNPSHASIYFMNEDGTFYTAGKEITTEPVDSSILGYELALASIVRKVYGKEGNVLWSQETNPE